MSATPAFESVPILGSAVLTLANTARDGTGSNIVDVVPAASVPAAGARIDRIAIKCTGQPANSCVTIFVNDGTNTRLIDEFVISGSPGAASTTAKGYDDAKTYASLNLPSGSKLQASLTVVPTSGGINVIAYGGALT